MFKTVNIYRLTQSWAMSINTMEAALSINRFVPCSATQDKSVGWVEPRGEAHGPLVELVAGQRIMRLRIQTKTVPGAAVVQKAREAADHIEATTGRKPGKKETKELREDARLALLPQAFPKSSDVWVWIDLKNLLLVTDASSQSKGDEVVTALVRAFDGLSLSLLQTKVTPQWAMTQWLCAETPDEWPEGFNIERECELRSADEEKSAVKFSRHHLCTPEIRTHIAQGKLPTRVALSWVGRVGFTLTEGLVLKKLAFLEGVFDDRSNDDSGFDADVALATGELSRLIPALVGALGGHLVMGQGADGASRTQS